MTCDLDEVAKKVAWMSQRVGYMTASPAHVLSVATCVLMMDHEDHATWDNSRYVSEVAESILIDAKASRRELEYHG